MNKDIRISKAQDLALESAMEYVLEVYPMPNYVEVVGEIGGDIVKRRYYNDELFA